MFLAVGSKVAATPVLPRRLQARVAIGFSSFHCFVRPCLYCQGPHVGTLSETLYLTPHTHTLVHPCMYAHMLKAQIVQVLNPSGRRRLVLDRRHWHSTLHIICLGLAREL